MNTERPYHVTLGPDAMSDHATFAEALTAFGKYSHLNHARIVNWVAVDVDFADGLTEEETEAVDNARHSAMREAQPQIIDLFETLKRSLEKAK